MSRCIIKLTEEDKEWYLEWSTIVDAPITYGMNLEELKIYIKEQYGKEGLIDLEKRLERVNEKGISFYGLQNVDDFIKYNRAGKNEKTISKSKIIKIYCHRK